MSFTGSFPCRKCGEDHVRTVRGLVSFYSPNGGGASLRDMERMIRDYSKRHPELKIFYGGDEMSIVGRHKGTLDRFGASS